MDQAQGLRALVRKKENELKLQPIKHNKLAKVITITSGKGGVGKTSISINLAMQLAALGNRVIIIDADIGLANVEVMLGIKPKFDLGDLMYGEKRLSDIITPGPMGISFISGGTGINELNNLSYEQVSCMTNRLYELDEMADYIIIDTGAGISDIGMQFIKSSAQVYIVVTPEPTSITDAYAVIKSLNTQRDNLLEETGIKMISNRVSSESEGEILYHKLNGVVKKFLEIDYGYMGAVVQDNAVSKSILTQEAMSMAYPNCQAVKCIKKLAYKIDGQEDIKQTKGISGIFAQMLFTRKTQEAHNGI